MNFPITPETKQSGRNVMTVVRTLEMTLGTTSTVPSIAAAVRLLPIRRCRSTLSLITMASSTTIPIAIRKANMESMLSVWSVANMSIPVPSIENGMPIATQKAILRSRKSASITNTMTRPCSPFDTSMSSRSRTSIDWSAQVTSSYPGGSDASRT